MICAQVINVVGIWSFHSIVTLFFIEFVFNISVRSQFSNRSIRAMVFVFVFVFGFFLHSKCAHNEFGVLFSIIIPIIVQTCCIILLFLLSHVGTSCPPKKHVLSLSLNPKKQLTQHRFMERVGKFSNQSYIRLAFRRIFNLCMLSISLDNPYI